MAKYQAEATNPYAALQSSFGENKLVIGDTPEQLAHKGTKLCLLDTYVLVDGKMYGKDEIRTLLEELAKHEYSRDVYKAHNDYLLGKERLNVE